MSPGDPYRRPIRGDIVHVGVTTREAGFYFDGYVIVLEMRMISRNHPNGYWCEVLIPGRGRPVVLFIFSHNVMFHRTVLW